MYFKQGKYKICLTQRKYKAYKKGFDLDRVPFIHIANTSYVCDYQPGLNFQRRIEKIYSYLQIWGRDENINRILCYLTSIFLFINFAREIMYITCSFMK